VPPDRHAPSDASPASGFVQRHWQRRGWLSALLSPLAALTGWHVRRRRAQYESGKRTVYRAPVPVVVVGNIYVGGTGKTPVVIATVQALRERGWTPGVVSRGYGTNVGPVPRVGQGALNPADVGDEPALIAHASGAPVAVHPRRALAVQALLKQYPHTDVIVSDDGLQHLALARDVEIVVQDERGVGNARLLPAGPLREPVSRLNHVDVIITNCSTADDPPTARTTKPAQNTYPAAQAFAPNDSHQPYTAAGGEKRRAPSTRPAHGIEHSDSALVLDEDGKSGRASAAPVTSPRRTNMHLQPTAARHVNSDTQRSVSDFADKQVFQHVAAVAGIGNPDRFFATLRVAGVQPDPCLALPDHYDYRQSPFQNMRADAILITSKDAIKCRDLHDDRLWEIPVRAQFSDSALFDWLDRYLRQRVPLEIDKR